MARLRASIFRCVSRLAARWWVRHTPLSLMIRFLGTSVRMVSLTNLFDPAVALVGDGVEFSNIVNIGGGPGSHWEADFTAGTLTIRLTNVKQTPSSVQNLIWDFQDLDYQIVPQQIVGMSTLVDTFPGGSVASFDNAAPSSPGKNHIRILQRFINGALIAPDQIFEATFSIQTTGLGEPMPGVVGDFNSDGVVDAADYSRWRDSLGSENDLAADASGNGVVDLADYNLWRSHYGDVSPTSSETTAAPALNPPVFYCWRPPPCCWRLGEATATQRLRARGFLTPRW